MHRQPLIDLINNYHPTEPEERAFKERMLAFITNYTDCFERTLSIGHITASAWLVNKDNSKALLMHHAKLNRWFQLGGHCDGDADVRSVAIKEAQEESGISGITAVTADIFDIDVHLIPANSKDPAHYHYDIRFLLQVTSDEDVVQNSESQELRWFGKHEQLPTDSQSVMRMFRKWAAYQYFKSKELIR